MDYMYEFFHVESSEYFSQKAFIFRHTAQKPSKASKYKLVKTSVSGT